MFRKYTQKTFIAAASQKHSKKYDYSLVNYTVSSAKITIICKTHGKFEQVAQEHLRGSGCPLCARIVSGLQHRIGTAGFITKAKEVHGNIYDYSQSNYTLATRKVTIVCRKHGPFEQLPHNHIRGTGCPDCNGRAHVNTEKFIERAKKTHGDRYDYSKTVYKTTKDKVKIICSNHGAFSLFPINHVNGDGCPKCRVLCFDLKSFIVRAKAVHGETYDYSKSVFVNINTKCTIVCKEHGAFKQAPYQHIIGQGCMKCASTKRGQLLLSDTKTFIKRAKAVHGGTYDYSKVVYTKSNVNVIIVCKIHGPFNSRPSNHLHGTGCAKCSALRTAESQRKSHETFVAEAKKKHHGRYTYEHAEYLGDKKKVKVTCAKHGDFMQVAQTHLQGYGCPVCRHSSGEDAVYRVLQSIRDVKITPQKSFKKCVNKLRLRFDFMVKVNGNVGLIEFNGQQHYKAVDYFGGKKTLASIKLCDRIKVDYCTRREFPLLILRYDEIHTLKRDVKAFVKKLRCLQ